MLFAFDLDKTICPLGQKVAEENVERFRLLENAGHKIAICSGKSAFYITGFLRQMGLADPLIIAENGAVIQFGIDLPPRLFKVYHGPKEATEAIAFFDRKIRERYPEIWFQPNEVISNPFIVEEEQFDYVEKLMEEYPEYARHIDVYRHPECFDFTPKGSSKRSGLERIAELLGITAEEIVAVGDGANDWPMFEYAGTAYGVNYADASKVDRNFASTEEMTKYLVEHYI